MEILTIDLSDINLDDKSFYIPFKIIPTELVDSIKRIGIINPPLLQFMNDRYTLIAGWKRVEACNLLGINKLICKVCGEKELSPINLIKLIYEDNRERYTDIEIGQLASIFIRYEHSIPGYLELIGQPRTDKNIERFSCLSKVDARILDLYLDEKVNPEQVFVLSQLKLPDALAVANRLIIPYRFNTNETREFVRNALDISFRDNLSLEKTVDYLLSEDENTTKDKIRYKLKKLRYPGLSRVEEECSGLIKQLGLPKHININHSLYFENNFIDLIVRISNDSELKELKDLIESDTKYKILHDLLNLVTHGELDSKV